MAARALKAGTVAVGWWRDAMAAVGDARALERGGPVAAVYRALRELGLGNDFERWAPSSAAPEGWAPLEETRAATLR
eukprot:8401532-Lingulodinium_polyedra.AAC.1